MHDPVQNGPDMPDNKPDIPDNKSDNYRTTNRTLPDTKPDIDRTLTGHYRTLPDKPDNRTPTAQIFPFGLGYLELQ